MGHQRVTARDIHHHISLLSIVCIALGVCHCFSWPVSGVLIHSCHFIKYGTLSHIRVAGQGDHLIVFLTLPDFQPAVYGLDSDRISA